MYFFAFLKVLKKSRRSFLENNQRIKSHNKEGSDEKFYHDISWNDEYAKKAIDIDDEDWCEKFEDEMYEVQDEIFESFDNIKADYIKKIAA